MTDMIDSYKAARRAGAPLIAISTPDQNQTIRNITSATGHDKAVVIWDVVRGFNALSKTLDEFAAMPEVRMNAKDFFEDDLGKAAEFYATEQLDLAKKIIPQDAEPSAFFGAAGLIEALKEVRQADKPDGFVLFFMNSHRFLTDVTVAQAIYNLRDRFKAHSQTLVLLGPNVPLPAELVNDVLMLDEAFPDRNQLAYTVREAYGAIGQIPTPEKVTKAVDAVTGLPSFPAESALFMSMNRDGLDLEKLWQRKNSIINATPGLTIYSGGLGFDDIGGVENVKEYINLELTAEDPPKVIVWIDEGEKMFAGIQGDNTGVSQDYLGQTLTFMQETDASGMILIGASGSGKSMIAKAAGSVTGIPVIQMDMGAMKGGIVGTSETNLRNAYKTIEAVSDGRPMFIMTVNALTILPPELKRRFTDGIFFSDIPDETEREFILKVCLEKYGVDRDEIEADKVDLKGWVGANIDVAIRKCKRHKVTLPEAAKFIVPVGVSDAERIDQLRREADGKYISASYGGAYKHKQTALEMLDGRKIAAQEVL